MTATTDTAMAMSSIMDTDEFTTLSCRGGCSSLPPLKQRLQSHSPPHPGNNIKWINPFDDKLLTSFPPLGGCATAPALPVDTGNLSNPNQQKQLEDLMVLASLGDTLIAGAGQDRHAKNTPLGDITKNPNDAKYSSLPLFLIPPFIGDQGDLDAYIGNPVLRHSIKKAFRGSQASLVTTTLLTFSSASLVLALPSRSLKVGAGLDGHVKNTS
jgi:hypothetical protein